LPLDAYAGGRVKLVGRGPSALEPKVIEETPIAKGTGKSIGKKVNLGRGLSEGGEKKANPIPVIEEKLPHKNVLPEFLIEGNKMPQVADPPSEIDNPLHKGTTWGDNPTGEVQSTNEGLKIMQTARSFGGPGGKH